MNNNLMQLIHDLVEFRTTSGNLEEIDKCFSYIEKSLSDLPFEVKNYHHNGARSIIWKSPNRQNPILLNAHLDVVPGSEKMFSIREQDKQIVGRGVSDMKFAIVCFISVMKQFYKNRGILPCVDILITSDEETGGRNGVGYFVNTKDIKYGLIIIPDGGDNWHIVSEAKGVIHATIMVRGESAHASRPWEGINAIDLVIKDLSKLRKKFPEVISEKWKTTINIGQIHGGKQTNQVPYECYVTLDIRYIPKQDKNVIKKIIEKACSNCTISYNIEADPFKVDSKNTYFQTWKNIINKYSSGNVFIKEHGASDGRYFSKQGIPVLISKPQGGAIHTENEWINKQSLFDYRNCLYDYLEALVSK